MRLADIGKEEHKIFQEAEDIGIDLSTIFDRLNTYSLFRDILGITGDPILETVLDYESDKITREELKNFLLKVEE